MAVLSFSPFTLNFLSPPISGFRKTNIVYLSQKTIQFDPIKKKRKPKPSFSDQIRDKWSIKRPNLIKNLPWQDQEQKVETEIDPIEENEKEEEGNVRLGFGVTESIGSDSLSFVPQNRVNLPPWVHGNKAEESHLSENYIENEAKFVEKFDGYVQTNETSTGLAKLLLKSRNKSEKARAPKETHFESSSKINVENEANFLMKFDGFVEIDETPIGYPKFPVKSENRSDKARAPKETHFENSRKIDIENEANFVEKFDGIVEIDDTPIGYSKLPVNSENRSVDEETSFENSSEMDKENEANFVQQFDEFFDETPIGYSKSPVKSGRVMVPWKREGDQGSVGGVRVINRNSVSAERLIPETELKRLRSVSKRMVERIKVGSAGVNQELLDSIRERWKENEVVKLKFEGAPSLNMKRTHEVLESRTGGLVIWRSGSSIVLYRGMTYNLPCVQSYKSDIDATNPQFFSNIEGNVNLKLDFKDTAGTTESSLYTSTEHTKTLFENEITDFCELDSLLEELGPRFKDWSGVEPVPVDADLLPSIDPRFKRPFRLLPYGMRQSLSDKETTFYRQSARIMPPHFALGRNRELQGLAMAMVKLWERSAIAKIAIKRGVQNTNNERMAEELKNLTGGTLLSRNKEYIVFYRGNDFLPPDVTQTLDEAQKLATLKEDEEEEARRQASTPILSMKKSAKILKVAGTLAETLAASSRWANEPSPEEREKMRRDSALARHASMVRYLQEKLGLAKGKIKKAERALEKLQKSLSPTDLPTDLETISDEERFLFRKIGLSMKPFLLLGRREMFDGTIENIHLHWKYREVVKLIVERKSFAQVKQIAIGLEAESGGVLVCVDKTMKGHVIILYRGKNYQPPNVTRPKNLLSKRQAWARSIELQRREALKHHISDLMERIEKLKAELENMKSVEVIDEETFYSRMDDASSDEEMEEEGDEEIFLDDSEKEDNDIY